MKKTVTGLMIVLLLVFACALTEAEEARQITSGVSFFSNAKSRDYDYMLDDDFSTYYPLKEQKGWLEIRSEEPVFGVYLMSFEKSYTNVPYELQIKGPDGEWQTVAQAGEYLINWFRIPQGARELRIFGTGKQDRTRVAELRLYGEGEKPADVQEWKTIGKCDMMLLTAHPDDELLWFAGLMPTYAGERRLRFQLAVMAPTGGERKLELLHAIWHCGVTAYPEFIGLVDKNGKTAEGQYTVWKGKNRVLGLVTEVIRKHQPEVLVTHAEKGEYGHGAHRCACDAAKYCFKLAAKAKNYPKSAQKYGAWQVKKLYIHEYTKNVIPCSWDIPLKAFGGKTGYQVAEEAFQFHRTQIKRNWSFDRGKEHDNTLFGLYATTVGQDTGTGDFMEHIDVEEPAGE